MALACHIGVLRNTIMEMAKTIELGVYRTLRRLGVNRQNIYSEASFTKDLFFDEDDWNCFLFFIEERFNIQINDEEAVNLVTVGNTVDLVNRHLMLN